MGNPVQSVIQRWRGMCLGVVKEGFQSVRDVLAITMKKGFG